MGRAPSRWHKLLAGGVQRRTRFHDELGQLAGLRAFLSMPRALTGGLLRLTTSRLPGRPWISYQAQTKIAAFLASRPAHVLEFGSGQSTRWFAARSERLFSLEADPDWFRGVEAQLAKFEHVDYRLVSERDDFANPAVEGSFDLVMIDGPARDACAKFAIDHLARGGMIYLDNSDKGANPLEGDVPLARRLLIDHAETNGLPWREFTDFAPAQFFVQRGLMVGGVSR